MKEPVFCFDQTGYSKYSNSIHYSGELIWHSQYSGEHIWTGLSPYKLNKINNMAEATDLDNTE